MITREEWVKQARTWIGTPFHHQGRLKGVGADCVGFLLGVGAELGIEAPPDNPRYGRRPGKETLVSGIDPYLQEIPLNEAGAADMLVFNLAGMPQHVSMLTTPDTMIHSANPMGVVEVTYDQHWRERAVKAYRLPGVV